MSSATSSDWSDCLDFSICASPSSVLSGAIPCQNKVRSLQHSLAPYRPARRKPPPFDRRCISSCVPRCSYHCSSSALAVPEIVPHPAGARNLRQPFEQGVAGVVVEEFRAHSALVSCCVTLSAPRHADKPFFRCPRGAPRPPASHPRPSRFPCP